jgi:hypothetical protein
LSSTNLTICHLVQVIGPAQPVQSCVEKPACFVTPL